MPPPSSFLTITSFPYSRVVTQAEFNAGTYGTAANEVWFRYEPEDDAIFGVFATSGGTFTQRIRVFKSDALTSINNNANKAFWQQVDGGTRYWVKVTRNGGGSSDFDFTFSANLAALNVVPEPGDLIINDDENAPSEQNSYPAIVMSTSGTVRGFIDGIPGGELGDSLESGVQLWHDRYGQNGSTLSLFDADIAFLSAFDTSPTLGAAFPHIVAHASGKFYVVNRNGGDSGKVFTVSDAGTVSSVVSDLNSPSNAIGVNADETIMYYAGNLGAGTAHKIHRWDLVNDVALSDLYTVTELASDTGDIALTGLNGHPGEILVLSDDTIVTYYHHDGDQKSVLLHLDPGGTLLHSYEYPWTDKQIDHLAWDPNDPAYVRVWFFEGGPENGIFQKVALATGAETTLFETPLFSAGINANTADSTMFGPSSSCTMVTAKRSAALEDNTDTGEGGSETIPTCCEEADGGGGGDVGTNPDPVGTLPPWEATCTGGGLVDGTVDLMDGESWL